MKLYESYGFSNVGSPECNQGGMVVVKSIDCRNMVLNNELSGTLQAKENGGQSLNYQNPVVYDARCIGNGQLNQMSMAEQANCLDCMHDQQAVIHDGKPPRKYIIRRLTPLECCRLQGFPDWWEDGVEGSDSARYKMWGNGMALADLERNYEKGYTAGLNAASEPMYRTMMAAICLALNELHGFGKKRLKDVLQAVDQKVLYSLTSVELVDEVFEKTGLEIVFHDTFDRIQEKE